jgi:hypothetical protein
VEKIPATKARQGRRGYQILTVLVVGLALAAAVWFFLEIYGEAIDAGSVQAPGGVETAPGQSGEQPNTNP